MKYSTAKEAINVVMTAGDVPVIIGTAGIGKTSMMKEIAEEFDMELFVMEGNLLKEGEAGGMPYIDTTLDSKSLKNSIYKVVKDENLTEKQKTVKCASFVEEINANSREVKYAPFHTIKALRKLTEEDPNKKILLFIDELNRCSNEVLQELMNIILQRNINGFEIPDNVYIVAAMNPSSKFENFKDTEFSTLELDAAQSDRLCFLELDTDVEEWIKWGNQEVEMNFRSLVKDKGNFNETDSIIHTDILEYIATFPESLNVLVNNTTEDKTPTPRAWERVSRAYYLYKNGYISSQDVFFNIVKGNIGGTTALEFINFTKEKAKAMMTPEEVFDKKNLIKDMKEDLSDEVREYVENESPIRLLVFNERLLKYLDGRKYVKEEYLTYIKVMHSFPTDMINTIYHEIQRREVKASNGSVRQSKLWKNMLEIPEFVEGFTSLEQRIYDLRA